MRITVPDDVVRRAFAEETIALNLRTGRYHGLNATAAEMLDALEAGATVAETAARIAGETGEPVARVEADLERLLRELADRRLVEIHERADA